MVREALEHCHASCLEPKPFASSIKSDFQILSRTAKPVSLRDRPVLIAQTSLRSAKQGCARLGTVFSYCNCKPLEWRGWYVGDSQKTAREHSTEATEAPVKWDAPFREQTWRWLSFRGETGLSEHELPTGGVGAPKREQVTANSLSPSIPRSWQQLTARSVLCTILMFILHAVTNRKDPI